MSTEVPAPFVDASRRRKRRPNKQDTKQQRHQELLKIVQSAALETSEREFWARNSSLVQNVVEASSSSGWFASRCEKSEGCSELLRDKATDLLRSSRRVIKEATETKSLDCLCVGTHGLRAVADTPLVRTVKNQEAVLKVLYHATVTAEQAHDAQNNGDSLAKDRAICYGLGAYQAVGRLLQDRSYAVRSQRACVQFQCLRSTNESASAVLDIFPVPKETTGLGDSVTGDITPDLLCTIALNSTLSVCRLLLSTLQSQVDENSIPELLSLQSLCSRSPSTVPTLIHLLCSVLPSWLRYLDTENDTAWSKEIVAHCKRAHLILWEAAGHIHEAEASLLLRQHSIASFLCWSEAGLPSGRILQGLQSKGHFEKACSLAKNAACMYAKQHEKAASSSGWTDTLTSFHCSVGTILDSFASGLTGSTSYLDFCVCRATHSFRVSTPERSCHPSCVLANSPFLFVHPDCRGNKGATILALYFLALTVRQRLTGELDNRDNTDHAFLADAPRIISNFDSVVLLSDETCASDRQRAFKLIWAVGLHRAVFDAIEKSPGRKASDLSVLRAAAEILGQIMGPLAIHFLRTAKDDSQRFWDAGLESYTRAISAWEAIAFDSDASTIEAVSHHRHSDDLAVHLTQQLVETTRGKTSAPTACIERAAKFLSLVGRRRCDLCLNPTVPLLLSIQLYTSLSSMEALHLDTLRLAARWSYLASVYTSQGDVDAAAIATVLALKYDVIEASSNVIRDPQLYMYRLIASQTRGILSPGDQEASLKCQREQRRALIGKVVSLFCNEALSRTTNTSDGPIPSQFSESMIFATLLNAKRKNGDVVDTFQQTCRTQWSLGCVLNAVMVEFHGNLTLEPTLSVEKIATMVEIISKFGQRLQKESNSKVSIDPTMKDYDQLVRLTSTVLYEFCEQNMSRFAIRSSFFVFCSVCLVSQHPLFEFDRWNLERHDARNTSRPTALLKYSSELLNKASEILDADSFVDKQDEWSFLVTALRPTVATLGYQLATIRGVKASPPLDDLSRSITRLLELLACTEGDREVRGLTSMCLVSLFSRLCDSFALEGERLQALQLANWNCIATRSTNDGVNPWFEATNLSLQSSDTILEVEKHLAHQNEDEASDAEFRASFLRKSQRNTMKRNELLEIREKLLWLSRSIEEVLSDKPNNVRLIWAKSSTLIGLAELSQNLGRLEDSIRYAGSCFKSCRQLTKHIGKFYLSPDSTSNLDKIAAFTILTRCSMRQVECLKLLSACHSVLGDRCKAEGYAVSALNHATYTNSDPSFHDKSLIKFLEKSRSKPGCTSQEIQCRRLIFHTLARSSTWDVFSLALREDRNLSHDSRVTQPIWASSLNEDLEKVFNFEAVSSFFVDAHPLLSRNELMHLIETLKTCYGKFLEKPQVACLANPLADPHDLGQQVVAPYVASKLRLSTAQRYLFDPDSKILEGEAKSACWEVIRYPPERSCRALALYYLASVEIKRAKEDGSLYDLWNGKSNIDGIDRERLLKTGDALLIAREHLTTLLSLLGPATDQLARDALRCLALVTGPDSLLTSELIHTSIGSGIRQRVCRAIESGYLSGSFTSGDSSSSPRATVLKQSASSYMKALDIGFAEQERSDEVKSLFSRLENLLPSGWRVVACAICPTGELMISSIHLDEFGDLSSNSACLFPLQATEGMANSAYGSIVAPLDRLLLRNQEQLQRTTEDEITRQQWWSERRMIDQDLRNLIADVDGMWFSSESAQLVLLGPDGTLDKSIMSSARQPFFGNLSSKFEAASLEANHGDHVNDHLVDVIDLGSTGSTRSGSCAILILDEHLQRFPFEGMPTFESLTVTRLPTLPLLVAKLEEIQGDDELQSQGIACHDLDQTRFIIDPESNLPGTRERIQPFLEALQEKTDTSWQGAVGEAPTKDYFEECVTQKEGMLLYFGHGNGQVHYSKRDVEDLIGCSETDASERRVRSSLVLMGCSSGRLESVNRRDTKLLDCLLPMYYEPEGVAQSYIAAGAPCVVGNLWDVTDRDIDKLAMSMLERYFDSTSDASLPECLAQARSACKLRYMIGCAPVCYGIPVFKRR